MLKISGITCRSPEKWHYFSLKCKDVTCQHKRCGQTSTPAVVITFKRWPHAVIPKQLCKGASSGALIWNCSQKFERGCPVAFTLERLTQAPLVHWASPLADYQVNVFTSSWHVTCALKSQGLSCPSLPVNCSTCHLAEQPSVLHCLLSAAISFQLSLRGSETTEIYFCILRCQSKMKHCRQERKLAEKSCPYSEEENPIFTLW